MTPPEALARELRRDGTRPLLTAYDDSTGERVELSVATTANWVAKTANWLADDHEVGPGDTVAVVLPLHWQAAVIALAAWTCGAQVAWTPTTAAALTVGLLDTGSDVELTLAPMGVDFSRLVASQPDALLVAGPPAGPSTVSSVPDGARILTTLPYDAPGGAELGLTGPLAAGGSVVLVRGADPAAVPARCATERVTHTLGVDVDGLPRLD